MRWVTREHPKIDRIACPWLLLRFIDAQAEFHYSIGHSQNLAVAHPSRTSEARFEHRRATTLGHPVSRRSLSS